MHTLEHLFPFSRIVITDVSVYMHAEPPFYSPGEFFKLYLGPPASQ